MGLNIFPKLLIFLAAIFLLNQIADSIDVNNYYQDSTSLTNTRYRYRNFRRYIRQARQGCQIPNNPLYTKYVPVNNFERKYEPGDYVQNYMVFQISCESEYSVNPIAQAANNHSVCIHGKWIPPLSHCLRTCPSLTSHISTKVKCKWNGPDGNDITLEDCITPVEGTTALLSCNQFYEEPSIQKNPLRVCIDGQWDPVIPVCYPICGLKGPKVKTDISNATSTESESYPWQVGVYDIQKKLICGGSILDYRVIISAAHCFTNYDGSVKPTENYLIAAGKHYREYDDARDSFAQYSKVQEIHIPSRYMGMITQQEFDIAIIILAEPFEITLRVQPICIELHYESQHLHLSIHNNGIVTGWGYTQNGTELSEELKEVQIPYIPYDECFNAVPYCFRRYITYDKICGGFLNEGSSVCVGDNGGGLIFKQLNSDQHYIKGIVSVSPAIEEGYCDSNHYSVYTSVAYHHDFVRKHLLANRKRHNIVGCTQDNCLNMKPVPIINNFITPIRKIDKKDCKLPNFSPNGKYIVNQNNAFEPGSYVRSNSFVSVRCDRGFSLPLSGATESYCSETGKWTSPLKACIPEVDYSCITPNNETAICKTLTECEVITTALSSGSKEAIRFAQESQCGKSNEQLVCCGSSGLPTPIIKHPLLPGPDICGIQAINVNEIDGQEQLTDPPWIVWVVLGISINNKTFSELRYPWSTLISTRYVLTAIDSINMFPHLSVKGVVIGLQDTSTCKPVSINGITNLVCDPPSMYVDVEETILLHTNYIKFDFFATHYIALMRLNQNVEFNAFIRPICLPTPTSELPLNAELWLTGFGGLGKVYLYDKKFHRIIQHRVSLWPKSNCTKSYMLSSADADSAFCTFSENKVTSNSICSTGLRAPAVRIIPNTLKKQWVQEGIYDVNTCEDLDYVGLFVKVSSIVDWIVETIRP